MGYMEWLNKKYLKTAAAQDADAASPVSLEEHDKRHHPGGFKEGDTCKFREELAKSDEPDAAVKTDAEAEKNGDDEPSAEEYVKMVDDHLKFEAKTQQHLREWRKNAKDKVIERVSMMDKAHDRAKAFAEKSLRDMGWEVSIGKGRMGIPSISIAPSKELREKFDRLPKDHEIEWDDDANGWMSFDPDDITKRCMAAQPKKTTGWPRWGE